MRALFVQDIVYFVDICSLYACRHAPYAAKLGICDNLSPKRTVITPTPPHARAHTHERTPAQHTHACTHVRGFGAILSLALICDRTARR
jgi:hypothetical protein